MLYKILTVYFFFFVKFYVIAYVEDKQWCNSTNAMQ